MSKHCSHTTNWLPPSDAAFILDPNQPVLSHGRSLAAERSIEPHAHPRGQLLWAHQGTLKVTSDTRVWVVPPSHAVWIPSGIRHQVHCETQVQIRNIYIDPSYPIRHSSSGVCMLSMSALMRELILRLTQAQVPLAPERLKRLGWVIIDELNALESAELSLPAGHDPRLIHVIQQCVRYPTTKVSLTQLASDSGASVRTLERLFKSETGLTFRQWRQRFRLLNSLERLQQGESSTEVAYSLGYQSVSRFIEAFRQQFGETPQGYARQQRQLSPHSNGG